MWKLVLFTGFMITILCETSFALESNNEITNHKINESNESTHDKEHHKKKDHHKHYKLKKKHTRN